MPFINDTLHTAFQLSFNANTGKLKGTGQLQDASIAFNHLG